MFEVGRLRLSRWLVGAMMAPASRGRCLDGAARCGGFGLSCHTECMLENRAVVKRGVGWGCMVPIGPRAPRPSDNIGKACNSYLLN